MKNKCRYNVEILPNTFTNRNKKPYWPDMIAIASGFKTRKEAVDFATQPIMNNVECRFFVVTFRWDKTKPSRITEVNKLQ